MGIYNPGGNSRLVFCKFTGTPILFAILVLILQLPCAVFGNPLPIPLPLALSLPDPISNPRPSSKVPQEFTSTAAPYFNFPGSITVCRKDFHEDCITLVELPGSVQRRCTRVPDEFNDRISSFEIKNGCCEFFRGFGCKGDRMLAACNEKKGTLFGITNNQISSWNCYFGEK